ncbi:MAG: PKD domain-containing protein, partial [Petrotogales bacterium]
TYKWYAIANDSSLENISNTWSFTTKSKSSGPPNQSPTADANGPYFGFIEEEIEFDGSESTDDGTIVNYTWDFGDDTNGYGINPTHTYEEAGEYTVILTVTDDEGETDNDETTAFINQPNRSPTTPILNGTKDGTKNTEYTYTAVSTDLDNDTIQYTFDWGDNETDVSEFLANGTIFSITHNWTSYGIYTVGVYATDENNATSGVAEFIVLIDIHYCDNIGYLIDNNSNGFYDLFYCNETDNETFTKEENGTYLIDTDGDDKWDYAYNQDTGLTLYYHYVFDKYYTIYKETPGFELITLLAMIAIVLAIMRRRRK